MFVKYRRFAFLLASLLLFVLSSCNEEAKYTTRKVTLSMRALQVSAGFAHFSFETDEPAYFLSGITTVPETTTYDDILRYQEQFKLLMLDSAYIDYLQWRHDRLADATHDIADFRDHTLKYTSADQYFQFLQPDSRYIVFAFVVDPVLRQPAGDLHIWEIHTTEQSIIPMCFSYRVNGYWDYVYPVIEVTTFIPPAVYVDPETGETVVDTIAGEGSWSLYYDLLTDVPWVGATVDSAWLREQGWSHPGAFFIDSFTTVSNATSRDNVRVLYGLYAHNNDYGNDGTSSTVFEAGHTYYTGLASLDGPLLGSDGRPVNYAIYRFRWDGPDTQLYFNPGDSADTRGAW